MCSARMIPKHECPNECLDHIGHLFFLCVLGVFCRHLSVCSFAYAVHVSRNTNAQTSVWITSGICFFVCAWCVLSAPICMLFCPVMVYYMWLVLSCSVCEVASAARHGTTLCYESVLQCISPKVAFVVPSSSCSCECSCTEHVDL